MMTITESALVRLNLQLISALKRSLSDIEPADVPEAGKFVWNWFWELAESRTYHASGPNPILRDLLLDETAWQVD